MTENTYTVQLVLTEPQKRDALAVRRAVFIEEQQVPEQIEMDQHDEPQADTLHFVAYNGASPIGAGRLRTYAQGVGKVERIAVQATERGSGIGRRLMLQIEETARQHGYHKLKLNAQTHARRFYEKLGYLPVGELFFEAGIEHIAMEKEL
ncbi:GNAT family N-acetyltransferase [Brevibacillus fulvus]|uniref:GNAT family N-acyltransferase n=1 Tax=Brevibacillus fulvus TaxID=1125967 RepID=A0A938XZ94_9BACL|nr:GNAT family N-acetyltransferase [Brevibacillus fulvus]MBM7590934.1 putative GNAT family N-acyltransferase [Brevibacillus fulvus]